MKKFVYFLNIIHYFIFQLMIKSHKQFRHLIWNVIVFVGEKLKIKKIKWYRNWHYNNDKLVKFYYNKKSGFIISRTHHTFGLIYTCYSGTVSMIIGGCFMIGFNEINNKLIPLIEVLFVMICYIPSYKAVFSNDRYLKYYKEFEKNDKIWHKKWKRRTIIFCAIGIVSFLSSGFITFGIAIALK